jgi:hypothetical protein
MNSKKINQLATELTPSLSDLTIIGDPSTGISKKITLSQMASLFTGTVEEYPSFASLPLVGTADTIYITTDTNILYRWDTTLSAYAELSPNIVTSLVFSDANGFDGNISLVGSVATLTITTALTTGSVPFIGASGALSQDNANLFFDDTNNRLGINTNSPTTALDVFGSGIIGRVNGTSTNNAFLGFASAGTNKWSIGNVQSDHRFRIYNEATTSELVSVLQTGEFGIGIANPTTKLHIDGGATALIANLDANVSVAKSLSFRSDNSARINLEVSGTESGSNVGADLFIRRYSDAGSLIDTPLTLVRSTGKINLTSSSTNQLNLNGGTTVATRLTIARGSDDSAQNMLIGWSGITVQRTNVALSSPQTDFSIIQQGSDGSRTPFNISSLANATFSNYLGINGAPGTAFPLEAYINSSTAYTTSSRGNIMRVYNTNTGSSIFAGIELGGAGTANDGLAGINAFVTGSGSAALTFYTRDGGTFSEKVRFTANGYLKASNTGTYGTPNNSNHEFCNNQNQSVIRMQNSRTSGGEEMLRMVYSAWTPNVSDAWFIYANDTTAARFYVSSNGGIGNYQANNVNLSDERTKKDIIPLESYWNKFKAIEIVKFKYKDQTHDDFNIGVIAQQVEKVAPEFIDVDGWEKPEYDEEGNLIVKEEEPLKSVYSSDLHHATIKVLQEAMIKIESLETEVAILKSK